MGDKLVNQNIPKWGKLGFAIASIVIFLLCVIDLRFGPDFRFSSKVIDPRQTGFDRNVFTYSDYNNYNDLMFVLEYLFPPGTKKTEIEAFLRDNFQFTRSTEHSHTELGAESDIAYQVTYEYPRLYRWSCAIGLKTTEDRLIFLFNSSDGLVSVYLRNGCGIFHVKGAGYE